MNVPEEAPLDNAEDPFGVLQAAQMAGRKPGFLSRALGLAAEGLITAWALSPVVILIACLALCYLSGWSAWSLVITAVFLAWVLAFLFQQLRIFGRKVAAYQPQETVGQKRVIVVGAGPAGLAVAKECKAQGIEVLCFEQSADIGGVYRYDEKQPGGVWKSLVLTTSPWITAFSDFPPPGESCEHYTHRQYLDYLRAYAERFSLRDNIRCRHRVECVAREPGGRWRVDVRDDSGEVHSHSGDHVVVCSGLNQKPRNFKFPGIEQFQGEVLHACEYKDSARFRDQRVLVVGLGESGADISTELAYTAKETFLSLNHGVFVVPRKNPLNGRANDYDTNRARYATPLAIRDSFMAFKRRVCFWKGEHSAASAFRAQLVAASGLGPMSQKSVKQDEFVTAAIAGKLTLKRKLAGLEQRCAVFEDGSRQEIDSVVFAHGYQPEFPFLQGAAKDLHPGNLYLNMFSPELGDGLVFCGFARPAIGSIPPTAELQARYFALLAAGKRNLPPADEMQREIEREARINCAAFPALARPNVVINWIPYMDKIAGLAGCRPDTRQLLRQPRLLWRAATGPANGALYRLHGEHNDPVAVKTLMSLPRMHSLLELATLVGLSFWAWPLSLFTSNWRRRPSNTFI